MQTNVHIKPYGPRLGLGRAEATVKLSFLRSEFLRDGLSGATGYSEISKNSDGAICGSRLSRVKPRPTAAKNPSGIKHTALKAHNQRGRRFLCRLKPTVPSPHDLWDAVLAPGEGRGLVVALGCGFSGFQRGLTPSKLRQQILVLAESPESGRSLMTLSQ